MEFSRQEYWSRLLCSPPEYLPNRGDRTCVSCVLCWQVDSLPLGPSGKSRFIQICRRCNVKRSPQFSSVQFSSITQSCLTLCNHMNRSTPGLPVHHQLLEFTQIHVHRVRDAIQPSHPLSSPSPPAPSPSHHQSLLQWVNSSHEVAKVLEFQLYYHSLQRNPRAGLLHSTSMN